MHLRRWMVAVLLALCFCTTAKAQDSSPTYFWALQHDTGNIVAFTLDGSTHTLHPPWPPTDMIGGSSLDDHTAFAVDLDSNFDWKLYVLTPDQIRPVTLKFDQKQIHPEAIDICAYPGGSIENCYNGWFLTKSLAFIYGPIPLLLNVDTLEAEPLFATYLESKEQASENKSDTQWTDPILWYDFSDDGKTLFYIENRPDTRQLAFIERNVETKRERVLHIIDKTVQTPNSGNPGTRMLEGDFTEFVADDQQWLFMRADWLSGILIDATGTTKDVKLPGKTLFNLCRFDQALTLESLNCNSAYLTYSDDIYLSQRGCESDCQLRIFPNTTFFELVLEPDAHPYFDFKQPAGMSKDDWDWIAPLYLIDHQTLVVENRGQYGLLFADGSYRSLGHNFGSPISPDGRWLIVDYTLTTGNRLYRIWDLEREAIVAEGPIPAPETGPSIFSNWYSAGLKFTLADDSSSSTYFFSFRDSSVHEMPAESMFEEKAHYRDFVAPDTFVYELDGDIRSYNVRTQVDTLLLKNASVILDPEFYY